MRDYGKVRTVFWSDDKVSVWPERSKFLALYLLTSPHANAIGCFRLPLAYISADTGLSQKEAKDTLDNLAKENFISWCPKTNYIFIHKYLDHNKIENAKVALHCIRLTREIPLTVHFLKGFADRFDSALSACNATNMPAWNGFAYPIDTLSKPIRYPEPEPEPEPEPDKKIDAREQVRDVPAQNQTDEVLSSKKKTSKASAWPLEAVVPEDWIAAGEVERAKHKLPVIDLRLEAARFQNYWASVDKPKKNWRLTWMNWILSERIGKNYNGSTGNSTVLKSVENIISLGAALDAAKAERGK